MFVYFIVYRDSLYYTLFTEKIRPRHFRRWAGLHAHTRKKKNLFQEIIEFINDAYQKELHYWKKAALESV